MPQKSKQIWELVFKLVIILLFMTTLILSAVYYFTPVVTGENTDESLITTDRFIIPYGTVSIILLVLYVSIAIMEVINDVSRKDSASFKKGLLIYGLVVSALILIFNIVALATILVKYNALKWGLALSNALFAISFITYNIVRLSSKKEIATEDADNNLFSDESAEPIKPAKEAKLTTKIVAEISISVALAIVFDLISKLIPFLQMPQGGSISLAMLPIFIIAYRRGIITGLISGLIFGVANFLLDGYILHVGSIFLDYLIPFTLLGLTGIFSKKAQEGKVIYSILGIILGGLLRYLCHSISGVLFFSEYAPETMTPVYYSFIAYNLPYMLASTALCAILIVFIQKPLITEKTRII